MSRALGAGRTALIALVVVLVALAGGARAEASHEAPMRDVPGATTPRRGLSPELPLRREEGGLDAPGPRSERAMVWAALLVLGAAVLVRRGVGRTSGRATGASGWLGRLLPTSGAELRVRSSVRLTPRASVHVLDWDGREWLIGASDRGIRVLARRESAAPPSPSSGPGPEAERARETAGKP